MMKDFSKYQKIIDEFRGEVLNANFETKFALMTNAVPKTEKFLLKMELKRLASPCTRLIDLRGQVDGVCKSYEHEGRPHFLDDIAVKVFEENIAYYGGFTFGVYEAVKNTENNFRVIYQNEKSNLPQNNEVEPTKKVIDKLQYPATFYQIGQYHDRFEERMNFAVLLEVTLFNHQVIKATSSDISIHGCKFRLNGIEPLQMGQTVTISFTGLEQEFEFSKNNNFTYEIRNIHVDGTTQLVGVKRVDSNKVDVFNLFLQEFIQTNKRRYKINLDNSLTALQARSLEQFCLPKINELPIFIEQSSTGLYPRYALTSINNQEVFQYWQDEKRHSTLHFLMNEKRLNYLTQVSYKPRILLVYSFIHEAKGQSFFYTADDNELKKDSEFMGKFLGFSANKSNFSITKLCSIPVNTNLAYSSFTVSDSLNKQDAHLNMPLNDDVIQTLQKLPFIIVVSEITDDDLVSEYKTLPYENIDTTKLKTFGHKRVTTNLVVDEIGINYKNHRQEVRFIYKTLVEVEIKGVKYQGISHDFSISGLKIELDSCTELNKGDVVKLAFPALQKITSAFDLKKLPYEIMKINKKKTIINLRVYVVQHHHIGRAFFKLLIEKNKSKITPDEYAVMIPGLAKSLRNIYANSLTIPSLIIQTSGSRYKIESIVSSDIDGQLLPEMRQLSDSNSNYNLYPLLNNLSATTLVYNHVKRMQSKDEAVTVTLYISINHNTENLEQAVTTKMESEFATANIKKMFISNALKRGNFFCIQMKISRVNEPDMDYLNPELSYISSYAIHRGKQIEQNIWSVVGVIELIDISQEAILRYQLSSLTSPEKIKF